VGKKEFEEWYEENKARIYAREGEETLRRLGKTRFEQLMNRELFPVLGFEHDRTHRCGAHVSMLLAGSRLCLGCGVYGGEGWR